MVAKLMGHSRQPRQGLAVLEPSGYCINAVRLHLYAADVLVRCGVDRDDFRQPPIGARANDAW